MVHTSKFDAMIISHHTNWRLEIRLLFGGLVVLQIPKADHPFNLDDVSSIDFLIPSTRL